MKAQDRCCCTLSLPAASCCLLVQSRRKMPHCLHCTSYVSLDTTMPLHRCCALLLLLLAQVLCTHSALGCTCRHTSLPLLVLLHHYIHPTPSICCCCCCCY
jgi:hypothetical protein